MRTALYKMWIEFCNSQEFVPMTGSRMKPSSSNEFHLEGSVSFNYALHNTPMTYPSSQYNAWRAFKYALDPHMVIKFLCIRFDMLKKHLPQTCIFLDLNMLSIKDMLEKMMCLSSHHNTILTNDFTNTITADIVNRKAGKHYA